jgi:predicted SprT family Zn-dependent metalloprotease
MNYTTKQRKRQDLELQNTFLVFNDRFFNGEISISTKAEFIKNVFNPRASDKAQADAHYLPNVLKIQIDDKLRGRDCLWQIVLLHEMAHAWLYQAKGYMGWDKDKGHGTTFQGVICRLIQIGAYDGLL